MEIDTAETSSEFSSQPNGDHSFTCMTCQSAFSTAEIHRKHFQTDWHLYNLKRKIAGLKPITDVVFRERVIERQREDQNEENNKNHIWKCEACKKVFNSENAIKNHELSKKHIESATKYLKEKEQNGDNTSEEILTTKKEPVARVNWKKKLADAKTEEDFNRIIDEKIKSSKKVEETDCLFCSFKGTSFENKMEHMTKEHTFYIPDVEYLVDMEGLIKYLGEKIFIGNTCIYCERTFHTLEAIQKHMIDRGHCKIRYDSDADAEISEYYDFSSLYDNENIVDNEEVVDNELKVTSEGSELILPSGAHIGHRDYRRYYNQNIKDKDESTAVVTVEDKYRALGYYKIGSSGMTIEKERLESMKEARELFRTYQKDKERMGIRNMKLQKYQRKQVPILYIHKNL